MDNTTELSLYRTAAGFMSQGAMSVDLGNLVAIVTAMRSGRLTWNAEAISKNGKLGRWEGNAALVKVVCEQASGTHADEVIKKFTASKVSRVATVVDSVGKHLLDPALVGESEIVDACSAFLLKNGGLTALYERLSGSDEKQWSLAQALATVVAKDAPNAAHWPHAQATASSLSE